MSAEEMRAWRAVVAEEVADAEYHRIDAYRVIKKQSQIDASHAGLASAVAEFAASEIALATADKDAEIEALRAENERFQGLLKDSFDALSTTDSDALRDNMQSLLEMRERIELMIERAK